MLIVFLLFACQNGRDQLDSPAALPTPELAHQDSQNMAVEVLQDEVSVLKAEVTSLQAQLSHYRCHETSHQEFNDSNCRENRVSCVDV